jgi:hypothetical protein
MNEVWRCEATSFGDLLSASLNVMTPDPHKGRGRRVWSRNSQEPQLASLGSSLPSPEIGAWVIRKDL